MRMPPAPLRLLVLVRLELMSKQVVSVAENALNAAHTTPKCSITGLSHSRAPGTVCVRVCARAAAGRGTRGERGKAAVVLVAGGASGRPDTIDVEDARLPQESRGGVPALLPVPAPPLDLSRAALTCARRRGGSCPSAAR